MTNKADELLCRAFDVLDDGTHHPHEGSACPTCALMHDIEVHVGRRLTDNRSSTNIAAIFSIRGSDDA